jgi:hypothetical protein
MQPHPHQGILIDKIPVEGVGGLIFALGIASVFLIGIPAFRPIVAFCVLAGAALAPILHLRSR